MDISAQCNWEDLMSTLATKPDTAIQVSAIGQLIRRVVSDGGAPNLAIVLAWYGRFVQLRGKTTVEYFKRVLRPRDLAPKALGVYQYILRQCPTDREMLAVQTLIDDGPFAGHQKISGRTVDTLMTQFPKYHNVCYYLDVTDKDNSHIVTDNSLPGRTIILFDIGASYRAKMHQFSKTYFDCFGRGDVVEHTLACTRTINISLCQFMFYRWAHQFQVFHFLKEEFDRIIVIRQYGQKTTYKPKKRKTPQAHLVTDIKRTILCPVSMTQEITGRRPLERVRMVQPPRRTGCFAPSSVCRSLLDYAPHTHTHRPEGEKKNTMSE